MVGPTRRRGRRFVMLGGLVVLAMQVQQLGVAAAGVPYDWPQFDGNQQHSGSNTNESTISLANVSALTRLFQISLPSVADDAPAYLANVPASGVTRNLLFINTMDGHILAVDAQTGSIIWAHQNGPGSCLVNNSGPACYTTSSPALDPNRQFVYSYGLDGRVHKYAVGDGTETFGGGWPEVASLKPFDEKGSSSLSVVVERSGAGHLYAANGGYPGDNGDYQGHITEISLATGAQHVFNATCSNLTIHFVEHGITSGPGQNDCPNVQTAVWARAGVVYDWDTNRIYITTGNGVFNPGSHAWGDSVLALHPDASGQNGDPLASYTPANFQQLADQDADLGSTAPVILPGTSKYPHLALQGSKVLGDGSGALLRLLNLDSLSAAGQIGQTGGEIAVVPVPQGGEVLTQPAVWTDPATGTTWVFVGNDNGISGLKLTVDGSGNPRLSAAWQDGTGGSSPLVANGVLYYAGNNTIFALNPTSGHVVWQSGIGNIHWESPVVANGVLYITDGNQQLTAYALPAALKIAIHSGHGTVPPFVSDTDFSGGSTARFSTPVSTAGVANAAPPAVYLTERYGNFSYTIPGLTPGTPYLVRLHFSENHFGTEVPGGRGSRVFNVAINGTPALTNFDIFATAGGANKAVVEQFSARADAQGKITIAYTSVVNYAKSSGIEILTE